MNVAHFILTRFSVRAYDQVMHHVPPGLAVNPLHPGRLQHRFRVFETVCLPSVKGQQPDGLQWIILIDKRLRPDFRKRLGDLVRDIPFVILVESDGDMDFRRFEWVRPYLQGRPDYILTTMLDDDDAIPKGFVAASRRHIETCAEAGKLAPIKFMGTANCNEWNMVTSGKAPLGRTYRWNPEKLDAVSAGFTFGCNTPDLDYSVLYFRHRFAKRYLAPSEKLPGGSREDLLNDAKGLGIDLERWAPEDTFYDIANDVGPMMMTNHGFNNQLQRVWKHEPHSKLVTGPESFPNIEIDWAAMKSNKAHFSRLRVTGRVLARLVKMIPSRLFGSKYREPAVAPSEHAA